MSFGLEECRNSELENRLTSYTVYTHALGHTEHPEVLYSFFTCRRGCLYSVLRHLRALMRET